MLENKTLSEKLYVIHSNGTQSLFCKKKFHDYLESLCSCDPKYGIEIMNFVEEVEIMMASGMRLSDVMGLAENIAANKVTYHPYYEELATKIVIDVMNRKTKKLLVDVVEILRSKDLISSDYYDIVKSNHSLLQNMIDEVMSTSKRKFNYFGLKTLQKGYLLGGVERPQHMMMRVAVGIHRNNFDKVFETFRLLYEGYFVHATPTLYNAGTKIGQLSSCFLLGCEDSIDSIFDVDKACGMISKTAGGIGLHVSAVRSKGSIIKSTGCESSGLVPMLKKFESTARYVNQGGKRNGSIAAYLEMWHGDIVDFLQLRKPTGSETERARDLFLGLMISDIFMERVDNDEMWSLFSPSDVPNLHTTWGDEHREIYLKAEKDKLWIKQMPARALWQHVVESQMLSGAPYLVYKDSVNRKSNQSHYGTIRSSNLCAEITLYSDSSEHAVCNLASISLPHFVSEQNGKMIVRYNDLADIAGIICENLDNVIDLTYYPTPEAKKSNMLHRPIGIGIQGLANVFFKLRIAYDSDEAQVVNQKIMEAIYYGAMKRSIKLAKERGTYPTYEGSPASKGILQPDMWNHNLDDSDLDWTTLREDLSKYGLRNSMLCALMPTASTSQILGNTEAFEPITSNCYVRRTIAGNFIVINPYLVKDLIKLSLWNDEMRQRIIYNKGSVQNIPSIPDNLKKIYKKAYELKQKSLIDLAIGRGKFVCHSQSLNLFMNNPSNKLLISTQMYAWKNGLKTGIYYLRQQPASDAHQITIDPELIDKWNAETKTPVSTPQPLMKTPLPTSSFLNKKTFWISQPVECEMCGS